MLKNWISVLAICALCFGNSQACFADVTVYVSFSDFGDGNAQTNVNNVATPLTVGQTGSAYVWIFSNAENVDTLVSGNVSLSNVSTVSLTSATVLNPDINSPNGLPTGDTRWSVGQTNNGTPTVTGDAINNLVGFNNVFAGDATGILLNQGFSLGPQSNLDTGFDDTAGTNSYLFAEIAFQATGVGTVDLNPNGFLLDSAAGGINFQTAGATINVVASVPEPGCLVILAGGCLALLRRRR